MAAVTEQAVVDALRTVIEPELHKDLITLNMVKDITIQDGAVTFTVVLTTPACPLKAEIKESCTRAVGAIPGVTGVDVEFTANVRQGRPQTPVEDMTAITVDPDRGERLYKSATIHTKQGTTYRMVAKSLSSGAHSTKLSWSVRARHLSQEVNPWAK